MYVRCCLWAERVHAAHDEHIYWNKKIHSSETAFSFIGNKPNVQSVERHEIRVKLEKKTIKINENWF